MQGAVIRMGGAADVSAAIAEGMVKAENEALKVSLALMVRENQQLREELELMKWARQRDNEEKLARFAQLSRQASRCPWWCRLWLAAKSFAAAFR